MKLYQKVKGYYSDLFLCNKKLSVRFEVCIIHNIKVYSIPGISLQHYKIVDLVLYYTLSVSHYLNIMLYTKTGSGKCTGLLTACCSLVWYIL